MKKILTIIVVIIVVAVLLLLGAGLGFGKGNGKGDGKGDGGAKVENSQTKADNEENKTIDVDDASDKASEGKEISIAVKISVVGNEYFYDNERLSLDELIAEIQKIDDSIVVEIKDDNASLKAYNAMIDALDENSINYIEK
ncbi:hypothetical protein ACTQ32_02335 [Roseburia faecis]|uniref:hypothetical protein n=1 Tax=Roseburia faecis TaxID=301302 RepID=UPI003F96AEA4